MNSIKIIHLELSFLANIHLIEIITLVLKCETLYNMIE